ncbi:histidine phosphatase family protein [Marinoscillum sp. MHG1-6]|uniref:SixA phosphatase family protein n=1 Tax=Marinoscillum sp. MHG1-6 TaxID=2959627 RepID=UPI002157F358|nr:histidine phosphatase family protein [Marinoscillum sp. MHG1-6]
MVRKIYLLRHGEALPPQAGSKDFERSLSSKGVAQIKELAKSLDPHVFDPTLVYCSPSIRTKMTLQHLTETMNVDWEVEFRDEVYEASVKTLFDMICDTDHSIYQLLLIGHNPGISYLAEYLAGESISGLEPGQLIKLDYGLGDWKNISQDTCSIFQ